MNAIEFAQSFENRSSNVKAYDIAEQALASFEDSDPIAKIKFIVDVSKEPSAAKSWHLVANVFGKHLYRLVSRALTLNSTDIAEAKRIGCWLEMLADGELIAKKHVQNAMRKLNEGTKLLKTESSKMSVKNRLQFAEEDRSRRKKKRIEASLRPANENSAAEFNEVWARIADMNSFELSRLVDFGVGLQLRSPPEGCCRTVTDRISTAKHSVYVFDLDETLILFNSLIEPKRYSFNWDVTKASSIGRHLESIIFQFLDSKMFFKQIERLDGFECITSLRDNDDLILLDHYDFGSDRFGSTGSPSDLRKLAYRLRFIRSVYDKHSQSSCGPPKFHQQPLLAALDELSNGWLSAGRRVAELCWASSAGTNVLVSSAQLTPTLAKLTLYGLSPFFHVENVYSSCTLGKHKVFERIIHRFTPLCRYHIIGDSMEEENACIALSHTGIDTHFHHVSSPTDLDDISDALEAGTFSPAPPLPSD